MDTVVIQLTKAEALQLAEMLEADEQGMQLYGVDLFYKIIQQIRAKAA